MPSFQQSSAAQNPIHTAGADGHDIGIEHHIGKAPVTIGRVLTIIVDDRLPFPVFKPKITGDPMVVLIDFSIAPAPIVKLTGADMKPPDKIFNVDIGLAAPKIDKINNLIPGVVGNPPGF